MPEVCLADGQQLHYRDHGQGPPLILLHGWGMSCDVFAEIEASLGRHCRCLCLDLPGHGGSPAADTFTLEALAGMVRAFVARLQLEKPVLLGWSMGGQVAQLVALQQTAPWAGLILVATTPRFIAGTDWPHGLPAVQLRALQRDLQRQYARALGEFFQLMFAGEPLPRERFLQIVRFAAGADRLPDAESVAKGLQLLRKVDLREQSAAISPPCLVIHGEADRIVPPGAGAFLAAQIPGAALIRMADTGHAPFLSHPQRFCVLVESFLHGLHRT